jgi:hypothetical protein
MSPELTAEPEAAIGAAAGSRRGTFDPGSALDRPWIGRGEPNHPTKPGESNWEVS